MAALNCQRAEHGYLHRRPPFEEECGHSESSTWYLDVWWNGGGGGHSIFWQGVGTKAFGHSVFRFRRVRMKSFFA